MLTINASYLLISGFIFNRWRKLSLSTRLIEVIINETSKTQLLTVIIYVDPKYC